MESAMECLLNLQKLLTSRKKLLLKINPAYSCFQYYQWFCTAPESRTQTVPYESSDSHAYCKGIGFVSCTGKLLPVLKSGGVCVFAFETNEIWSSLCYNISMQKYLQVQSPIFF